VAVLSHGPTIYRDGQKLPVDLGPFDYYSTYSLAFSRSASILYGISVSGDFLKYDVKDNGVSFVKWTRCFDLGGCGSGPSMAFGGGLIYMNNGSVIDPEVPKIVGAFSIPSLIYGLAPDPQSGRLYVLGGGGQGTNTATIYAFDINNLSLIDSVVIPGVTGGIVKSFVRWGANGFAFRTTGPGDYSTPYDQVFVIRTSLVPSAEPIDLPAATPPTLIVPPTPTSTIRQISLPNDDLIYDQLRGLIYASVPGYAGANGNTITPINPATGAIGFAHNIGINPGKLAISRDDQYLYTAIISEHNVRRFNLQSQTIDAEFDIQSTTGQTTYVTDMAVMPDDPTTAVVATSANLSLRPPALELLVYKNGAVLRQKSGTGYAIVETTDEPSVFYGAAPGVFVKYQIGLPGPNNDPFSQAYICENMIGGYGDVQWDAGLLFDNSGRVADPQKRSPVATFLSPPEQPVFLADAKSGHVYFLSGRPSVAGSTWTITAYDRQTFVPLASISIPGVKGETGSFIRWGPDGLAFGTGGDQIFLIQSPLFKEITNPVDDALTFVRQQYLDFLNREPDQGGWDYWSNQISQCGNDAVCISNRRIGVSAAFFIEQEFQQTGSVVYRMYRAAYGTVPSAPTHANITYAQFIADRALVVGGPGLAQSTVDFANNFVQRPAFKTAYPDALTPTEFVNNLFTAASLTGAANASLRQTEIAALTSNGKTRAQVLLDVIEVTEFKTREYNQSFVLMQYFGYLRREAEQAGYDFWLDVLNNKLPNDASGYRGMVCAFITSAEYQLRFGTSITRSDQDCSH
jgi:hypothetical protein